MDCMVNCIATEADCVRYNSHTPGVNPHVDPYLCSRCPISACAACEHHDAEGAATCKRCFVSFAGIGGSEGKWTECVIWDQNIVKVATLVFSVILVFFTLLLVVTTAVGALKTFKLSSTRGSNGTSGQPLLGRSRSSVAEDKRHNIVAIQQGLQHSIMSSIKFSSLIGQFRKKNGKKRAWLQILVSVCRDNETLNDMGIGLQLFFNTQCFLIAVAFITWIVARFQGPTPEARLASKISGGWCPSQPMDLMNGLLEESPRISLAENNRIACLVLWLILLFASWGFHYYQSTFISNYDRATHSAEDYTLRLTGVPENYTSERRLKHLLERELRMDGKIHGVCICYDINDRQERLEEMLENMTEYDTWQNQWCPRNFCIPDLEDRIKQDGDDFRDLIKESKLKSTGEVYVCFKKQRDMVQVQEERRGIRKAIFELTDEEQMDSLLTAGHFAQRRKTLSKSCLKVDPEEFVAIDSTFSEPSGIRFWAFGGKGDRSRKWMPLRMFVYIGIYSIVAQLFYSSMIRPWQDNFIEGAASSGAVAIVGKLVILLNFAIQTLVMVDVEHQDFTYVSDIDQRTFLWNTLLLVITNAYVIMQECYREGMRWNLRHPSPTTDPEAWWHWQRHWFQGSRIEGEVGNSLAEVMTEQILMLYVIGEVANVLGPVMFYWVALRGVYVWKIGGDGSRFQELLRAMLPKSRSQTQHCHVTAREAEKAQILMPLLLWMEYTYVVVFAWMAFCTFFLASDMGSTVCGLLFVFSVLFYIWQRFVMLWMYGKATYDSEDSYKAFIHVWGFVLGILPPMSVWWSYRLNEIIEMNFVILMMVLVFLVVVLVYQYGIVFIGWEVGNRYEAVDTFEGGEDPGYASIMDTHGYSWWNLNPIYVLKCRYCPNEPQYEVHAEELLKEQWPSYFQSRGFFELGKEFRHEQRESWEQRHSAGAKSEIRNPLVSSTMSFEG